MQVPEEDALVANLCGLCSWVERSFFSAFAVPSAGRTIRYHESLGDLVKSASGGCGLCKVFLRGFLHAQLKFNERYYSNIHAVKDYFITMENLALFPHNSECEFYLRLKDEPFLVPGLGNESGHRSGFVSMELWRFWQHQDARRNQSAMFSITSEAGSAPCLEGHFYGRAISAQPDLNFAKSLFRECQQSHKCSASDASEELHMPTRLISVCDDGPGDFPCLKLVESHEYQPYFALSHRWATAMDCVTSLDNIEERMNNLDFDVLPRTFQDAVLVTLALGYDHLWIDCICIIQDDNHDWETECPKMAHIYGNADLTIAAVTATDDYAGFLGVRSNPDSPNSCKLRYWNKQQLPADIIVVEYVGNGKERWWPGFHNLLDSRGWTLQERMLSPRVLSFSQDKIFWECKAYRRLESLHFVRTDDRHDLRTIKLDLKALDMTNVYRWWYEILDDYCRRELTFPMDKLPAISGIAAAVQRVTGDTYVAGLWQNDIASGLAWMSSHTDQYSSDTQPPYRAPSWSWARSDCRGARSTFPVAGEFTTRIHGYVKFISAKVNLRGKDLFGEVVHGAELSIQAPTKQGFMGRGFEIVPGQFAHNAKVVIRLPDITTDRTALRVSIDDPEFLCQILDQSPVMTNEWGDEHEGLQVTTIHLCSDENPHMKRSFLSYGLVLMRTGDGSSFRRVGLLDSAFYAVNEKTAIEEWFADAEMQDLKLV